MLDLLFVIVEAGLDNNMIQMMLENRGYSEKEAREIIYAAGIGQERKKLKSWARQRFIDQRR